MEGYCEQCLHTENQKPHKEFKNYEIMIHCTYKNKDVNCYGKEKCFCKNDNWQHLRDE